MDNHTSNSGLATYSLSMWYALAQGLGTNGPAAVTALFFVGIAGAVGASMTLVLVLSFIIYSGMTLITYEWSKEVSSAYSWAAFHRKAFNKSGKFLSYYGGISYYYYYLLGYTGFAMLGLTAFLYALDPSLASAYPWIWIPLTVIIIGETTALNFFGIKLSLKYVLYTGLAEITFLIVTSIALIIIAGPNNSAMPFTAAAIHYNYTTIGVEMILGIATFGGLNSVVPVAEETKNPKRNIPFALGLLAAIIGTVILLSSYAQTVVYGIGNMFNYANLPDPGIIVYTKYLGLAIAAIFAIFIINSFNSSGVGFLTSTVRTSYAYARDNILFPKSFTKINKHKVPGNLVIFTGILSIVIAIVSGLILGPLTASLFLIISNSIFSFSNHAIAGIGLGVYHKRNKSLKIIQHLIIPWAVVIALIVAIVYVVYPAPAPPLNYASYIAGLYLIFIVTSYLYYRAKKPEILEKVGEFSL
jgi:amino acid transporter